VTRAITCYSYIQFCVEDDIVYIREAPSAFPPHDEVNASRWEYEPPPYRIPSNVFLHFLNSRKSHVRDTWLKRLPKKLKDSIHARQGAAPYSGQVIGWGIHILEAPNGIAIIWITVGTTLLAFLLAVLWAALKEDVQGAFGIGAFVVAAQSAIAFAFFNYYPIHSTGKII
jgi:hypothetical protein